jgi:hypothetical protein
MTPQEIFAPKELKAIMDCFRVAASGEAILSVKDTKELDGYVSRYNAALIQAGENPTDAAGLAWAITSSSPE